METGNKKGGVFHSRLRVKRKLYKEDKFLLIVKYIFKTRKFRFSVSDPYVEEGLFQVSVTTFVCETWR